MSTFMKCQLMSCENEHEDGLTLMSRTRRTPSEFETKIKLKVCRKHYDEVIKKPSIHPCGCSLKKE